MKETFEQLDSDKDGLFTAADLRQLTASMIARIDANDIELVNQRLKATAALSLPEGWVADHFAHAPMWTFLSTLSLPVGLFHGTGDNLTPVDGTRWLEAQAKQAGKSNMEFQYFEGLDHSLGILPYFVRGTLPAGHTAIFEYIRRQVQAN
jgi:alpha-beta hydrolase superfamily lysophospholipase